MSASLQSRIAGRARVSRRELVEMAAAFIIDPADVGAACGTDPLR